MNIYLDESYNLQRTKGKQFISINGFAVLDDKILRKRWKDLRKPYLMKKRIHATDSRFQSLSDQSVKILGRHDLTILSIFQVVQEIENKKEFFGKEKLKFDKVYTHLVQSLLKELKLNEYKQVRIIVDARKHKGGIMGKEKFQNDIEQFLKEAYSDTKSDFKQTPSYLDILVELADFVSNRFYKEYQKGSKHLFNDLGFRLIQIKNPL